LIRRLSVKDHNAIFEMISAKAYFGGILIAILALFYWIFISSADDSLDTGVSILGTLSFPDVAIAVMALGLLSALFRDYSRELGHLFPSLVSGVMIIVCGFYAVEPLVYGFVSNDLEAQTALWRSARLGLLWGGVTYCAHYLVDAFLLYWLKQFCANHDINISSVEESVAHEHLSAD
jgi:xanthine/uracil permease